MGRCALIARPRWGPEGRKASVSADVMNFYGGGAMTDFRIVRQHSQCMNAKYPTSAKMANSNCNMHEAAGRICCEECDNTNVPEA